MTDPAAYNAAAAASMSEEQIAELAAKGICHYCMTGFPCVCQKGYGRFYGNPDPATHTKTLIRGKWYDKGREPLRWRLRSFWKGRT